MTDRHIIHLPEVTNASIDMPNQNSRNTFMKQRLHHRVFEIKSPKKNL